MKSRFAVVVSYVVDVEAEDENHALSSASFGVKYGSNDTRHLSLSICGVEKIEVPETVPDLFPPRTLDEAIALSTVPPETLQPVAVPATSVSPVTAGDDIPF